MVLPFLWMISTSLRSTLEITRDPHRFAARGAWPASSAQRTAGGRARLHPERPPPGAANYVEAWQSAPFGRYFFNTIVVALACVLAGVLVTSTLAAYAFARLRFSGRDAVFLVFLSMMMVPEPVYLVPSFIIMARLHWLDTYTALIVPWTANVFSIFLLRQHFKTIPQDLFDAATIDGAGRLAILWRIMMPLSKAVLVTIVLFTMIGTWNSFLWPLVMTHSPDDAADTDRPGGLQPGGGHRVRPDDGGDHAQVVPLLRPLLLRPAQDHRQPGLQRPEGVSVRRAACSRSSGPGAYCPLARLAVRRLRARAARAGHPSGTRMGRWSPAQIQAMIEEYNALHPELPVRAYDMSRYQALSQKIIAAVAAGQPPTISQAYEAWTAEMIEPAASSSACSPMPTRAATALTPRTWPTSIPSSWTSAATKASSGPSPSTRACARCSTIATSSGGWAWIPIVPPTTWEDWRAASAHHGGPDGDGRNDRWGTIGARLGYHLRHAAARQRRRLLLTRRQALHDRRTGGRRGPGVHGRAVRHPAPGLRHLRLRLPERVQGRPRRDDGGLERLAVLPARRASTSSWAWRPCPARKQQAALIQGTNLVVFAKASAAQKRGAGQFIRFLTEHGQRDALVPGQRLRPAAQELPRAARHAGAPGQVPGLAATYAQLRSRHQRTARRRPGSPGASTWRRAPSSR